LEKLTHALLAVLLAHAEIATVEVERLLDGQEPVEVDVLGRQADGLAGLDVVVDGIVAEYPDLAAGRAGETGRAVEGRLAGAVGPDDADAVTRLERDVDASEHRRAVGPAERDVAGLDALRAQPLRAHRELQ